MNCALVSMRLDYDQAQLKPLDKSKNSMLEKRRQKLALSNSKDSDAGTVTSPTNVTVL